MFVHTSSRLVQHLQRGGHEGIRVEWPCDVDRNPWPERFTGRPVDVVQAFRRILL